MIPRQIREEVELILSKEAGIPEREGPRAVKWETIGGGSINNTYRLQLMQAPRPFSLRLNPEQAGQETQPETLPGKTPETLAPATPHSSAFHRFFHNPFKGQSHSLSQPKSPAQPASWFCKLNTTDEFPEMFEKEIRGLALLKSRGGMQVPRVIGLAEAAGYQVLVLEWIEEGPRRIAYEAPAGGRGGDRIGKKERRDKEKAEAADNEFWTGFGESLAKMHRVTNPFFGLEEDNYMGALPQSNSPSDKWTDFFVSQRLEPQVKLAVDKSLLDMPLAFTFERLYRRLPAIFPEEPPALLHGDCWGGNYLRKKDGQVMLIDPAAYYGHRSMDLAMTTLFGGFSQRFYDSYNEHYPFPDNHLEQWEVCNLYPLLIHLNLFGEGYLPDVVESLRSFV
ncbi:MAG: fructosamine kinase family protein [Puia sp.]|nr:fructosamine kinase family protein [Puia sp.]